MSPVYILLAWIAFVGSIQGSSSDKACPANFAAQGGDWCYHPNPGSVSTYADAHEICHELNVNAKILTFESDDHFNDFANYYSASNHIFSGQNVYLGYAAIIDTNTNKLERLTEYDDTDNSIDNLTPNLNNDHDSSLSSTDNPSQPKKCVMQDFQTSSTELTPTTVECDGINNAAAAVCVVKKSDPITCNSACNCTMDIDDLSVRVVPIRDLPQPSCPTQLNAGQNRKMTVNFVEFNVPFSSCCRDQHVRVEDGTGKFRRFCGEKPAAFQTNDNVLKITLNGPQGDKDIKYVADVTVLDVGETDQDTPLLTTKQRPSG